MLAERIKDLRSSLNNATQKEFANLVNFPYSRVQDIERGKVKELKAKEIEYLQENLLVDSWWLLTGKGEMLLSDEKELSTASNNHCFEVDMLNVRAGAGEGIYNYEIEVIDKVVLDKAFFRNAPDTNKIKIIEVDGDSMEPTLSNGDFIIIDETKTNKIDGIYAIQLDGQLLVKRLEFNLDNTITIISDNQRYSNKIYNPNETQIPFNLIGMKTLSIQR